MSPSTRKILFSSMPCYLGALSFGFVIGYTSPSLPKMQEIDEPLYNSPNSSAWFGSLATIGGMLGCPLAGILVDKLGRKKSIMASSLPFLIGWLGIAWGTSLDVLYLARLLTGLGGGMVCVVSPLYISETSSKEIRGKLGTGVQLFVTIGIVLVYGLGVYYSWRSLALWCSALPVITLLFSFYIPETPRYLLDQGNKSEAYLVLLSIRETSSAAELEMDEMVGLVEEDGGKQSTRQQQQLSSFYSDLMTPDLYKPLLVSILIMAFQQLTGINVVMFYTVSIFMAAGFEKQNGGLATLAIGLVQVVFTFASAMLMDRAGRRILLMAASLGMCVSCFVMAACYRGNVGDVSSVAASVSQSTSTSNIGLAVLISLIVYVAAFALGWGPIPMLLTSEIFPAKTRGTAMGLATLMNWFMAFLVTLYFEDVKQMFGMDGVFGFFGACSLLATMYVFLYVPETKGKSLEDISAFFFTPSRIIRSI
ncbi:hypothetical protein HELRODRAFT_114157 [Helobdella robusta]|uniref:Major facilitator superfamily (MFS) profile domain-containing protein n=1 Tax=Helobdella robusta TaxID=6412 RepID=T1EFZ7_HELRO|nr:hypothetical protein HELRODRAFT_114157 [Helobdella robusta]ESN97478.1 hypothetical protein HELRODRAFT_114157 [Helobdella robusta]